MRIRFPAIALMTLLALTIAPAAWAQLSACQQDCYHQNDVCMFGEDGTQTPTYWRIEECDQIFQACMDHCANCPYTREYTTVTVLDFQFTGAARCLEDIFQRRRGIRYYEARRTERVTTYREVQQCDGTTSTTVVSSQDRTYYCWARGSTTRDLCSPYFSNLPYLICPF